MSFELFSMPFLSLIVRLRSGHAKAVMIVALAGIEIYRMTIHSGLSRWLLAAMVFNLWIVAAAIQIAERYSKSQRGLRPTPDSGE